MVKRVKGANYICFFALTTVKYMNLVEENILKCFSDYLKFDKQGSENTVRVYVKRLRLIIKDCGYPLTLVKLEKYISDLKRKDSPAFINHNITVLNCFSVYQHLGYEDRLNRLRSREIKEPDPNDLLSPAEVKTIIDNSGSYSLLFELIYKTGCRSGEAISLHKKDFAFQNSSLTFYDTKTHDNRTVAIPPDMEKRLNEYLSALSVNDFIFKGKTHCYENHISQGMVNRKFGEVCQKFIGRESHVHCLRHSMITHLLIQGCPISTLQAIVGHRRLATTQLYTHVVVNNQREAMLLYNPLIRQGLGVKDIIKRFDDFIRNQKLEELNISHTISHTKNKYVVEIVY